MKPVFLTAAYHSRAPQAAGEMESLEQALWRRAGELRDCETGSIDLSAPGWEGTVNGLLRAGRRVWVQPVLLWDGEGLRKLEALSGAAVGRPLLTGEEDFAPLLAALGLPTGQKALLLAHGGETAAPLLRKLSGWLAGRGEPVFAAALKGEPGWEEAAAWLEGQGTPGEVLLVPLLLTAGVHLRRDMDIWQERLEEMGIRVSLRREGLAGLEKVREMYRGRVEELLR